MPNPLTLKQRLAALAVAPSSSVGLDPPKSPGAKRRAFFNPSWVKRPNPDADRDAQDRMQEVMSRMIYQAGVDFE